MVPRPPLRVTILALALVPALATAQPFTPPVPLNPDAAIDGVEDSDLMPTVAAGPNAIWLAAWVNEHAGGFLLARSSDDGRTWSAPSRFLPGGRGVLPRLATDGGGRWVVVWEDQDICQGCSDVWVAHSADEGVTWSAPQPIAGTETAGTDDLRPSVTVDGSGAFLVTWYAVPVPSGGPPYAPSQGLLARSTDGGANWTITTQFDLDLSDVDIAAGGSTVIAAWDQGYDGIYYARSSNGGITWSPTVTLVEYWYDINHDPVVATDRHGSWIIVWERGTELPSQDGYYGDEEDDLIFVRSEDDGLTWSEPAWLNLNADHDTKYSSDRYLRVAVNEHGVWAAVWQALLSFGRGRSNGEVLVAWSYDGAKTWTPPQALNRNSMDDNGWNGTPDIAGGPSGAWVAVWYGSGVNGADSDVYVERAGCACAPCDVCDQDGRCITAPRDDCAALGPTDTARLLVQDAAGHTADRLVWKLALGASQSVPDLDDPRADGTVGLCIYAGDRTPSFRGIAPAGLACGRETCWSKRGTAFAYRRDTGGPDGVVRAAARSVEGIGRLTMVAQGPHLTVPPLPLATPLVTQLQVVGGRCWEAAFTDAATITNRPRRFLARATGVP